MVDEHARHQLPRNDETQQVGRPDIFHDHNNGKDVKRTKNTAQPFPPTDASDRFKARNSVFVEKKIADQQRGQTGRK